MKLFMRKSVNENEAYPENVIFSFGKRTYLPFGGIEIKTIGKYFRFEFPFIVKREVFSSRNFQLEMMKCRYVIHIYSRHWITTNETHWEGKSGWRAI